MSSVSGPCMVFADFGAVRRPESSGGLGGVSFFAQLFVSLLGCVYALLAGFLVYGVLKAISGIRLSEENEFLGADLSIHKIGAYPEEDVR